MRGKVLAFFHVYRFFFQLCNSVKVFTFGAFLCAVFVLTFVQELSSSIMLKDPTDTSESMKKS